MLSDDASGKPSLQSLFVLGGGDRLNPVCFLKRTLVVTYKMGECSSRTPQIELLEHEQHDDHSNDSRFIVLPDLNTLSLEAADKATLLNQLKLLRLRKSMIKARVCKEDNMLALTNCLTWEIRKSKGIDPKVSWFNEAKISVRSTLEPGGPSFETNQVDLEMPKWYRLFEVKQSLTLYTRIEMKVILQVQDKVKEFGSCNFAIDDIVSQECFKGWLPIDVFEGKSSIENAPMLEVRAQYLHDEHDVIARYNKVLQNMIVKTVILIQQDS